MNLRGAGRVKVGTKVEKTAAGAVELQRGSGELRRSFGQL